MSFFYKYDPVTGDVQQVPQIDDASFLTDDRRVALDEIGDVRVSTVFLVINHAFADGPPVLFETMIFGGDHDESQWRYCTRDEALAGHAHAVALVREKSRDIRLS